jgi:hypothetical protein
MNMGQFIIKTEDLTIFLKRLESVERYYEKWFISNNESLIYYFERNVSTTEPTFIHYKFKEDKLPVLPEKIKSMVDFLINNGTIFKIRN